jgi:preprotein translocase subunit Sec63
LLQLECEFALLGCQPWAIKEKSALASRYRKMQLRLHPDKVTPLKDAQLIADASLAQRKIMKAYETVSGCL